MKKVLLFHLFDLPDAPTSAQGILSLDSCRALAIAKQQGAADRSRKSKRRTTGKKQRLQTICPKYPLLADICAIKKSFPAE